jgi:type I restriction enzyme S subunit
MRSNYRPIGKFIRLVENNRNTDLKVTRLLGLSMTKEFRDTTSNIVGTDMSVYKVMQKWQFACDFMSPIRVNKLPVVLKMDDEPNIVSPAYPVFEVKDKNDLDPEYLMMWFSRPEFDRYATFKCDSAIRGGYDWEELCNTEIPVPHIDKQREIVAEYNTILHRIGLNNGLIQKLEETAQAIFKQWFVDFEFPNENGEPYKSAGGEMMESELGDIPTGWKVSTLNDTKELVIDNRGKTPVTINYKVNENDFPVISARNLKTGKLIYPDGFRYLDEEYSHIWSWKNDSLKQGDIAMTTEAPMGELYYFAKNTNYILSQRVIGIRTNKDKCRGVYLYFWLQTRTAKQDLEGKATGTTVSGIKQSELLKVTILVPDIGVTIGFEEKANAIMEAIEIRNNENLVLNSIKDILLSKLATLTD